MFNNDRPLDVFVDRLKMIADLPADIHDALEGIVSNIKNFGAGQDIVSQGERPSRVAVLLDGWICRNKMLANGRRQITAFHFAGVTPNYRALYDYRLGLYQAWCSSSQTGNGRQREVVVTCPHNPLIVRFILLYPQESRLCFHH